FKSEQAKPSGILMITIRTGSSGYIPHICDNPKLFKARFFQHLVQIYTAMINALINQSLNYQGFLPEK
ncbi:MAG TPA: hypothetical protein PLM29_11460, partial [Deltaproteobacteria bacterium]|nr:hypothetical protein [Deltaproteobacteria bacterium]